MPKVLNKRVDKIPPEAIYVGRPSRWGNPFRVQADRNGPLAFAAHRTAVKLYKEYIFAHPEMIEGVKRELKGKDLVCWCSPLPCHADVLLEIANCET